MLCEKISRVSEAAFKSGSLVFTPTTRYIVEETGILFEIRFAPSLAKKPTAVVPKPVKDVTRPRFNPFLPPDPALVVEDDFTDAYRIVLNKFCVVQGHALLITKGKFDLCPEISS